MAEHRFTHQKVGTESRSQHEKGCTFYPLHPRSMNQPFKTFQFQKKTVHWIDLDSSKTDFSLVSDSHLQAGRIRVAHLRGQHHEESTEVLLVVVFELILRSTWGMKAWKIMKFQRVHHDTLLKVVSTVLART